MIAESHARRHPYEPKVRLHRLFRNGKDQQLTIDVLVIVISLAIIGIGIGIGIGIAP